MPASGYNTPAQLTKNDSGVVGIELDGKSVHSPRNAIRESQRLALNWIDELSDLNESTLLVPVILGIGWGYHLFAFAEAASDKTKNIKIPYVFAFEPALNVRSILQRTKRGDTLRNSGVRIIEEPSHLQSEIKDIRKHNPDADIKIVLFIHPFYKRNFPRLVEDFQNDSGVLIRERGENDSLYIESQDMATRRHFGNTWFYNHARLLASPETSLTFISGENPARTSESHSLHSLVYCGAGPTLFSDLQRLTEILPANPDSRMTPSPKFPADLIIVAVDTALAPLLHMGILPHYVISVDAGRGTLFHLSSALNSYRKNLKFFRREADELEKIPATLITWTGASKSLTHYFKNTIYYRSTFPLDQILGTGPLQNAAEWRIPARNPAGISLLLSKTMGIGNVYLAGTGFQIVRGMSHLPGTGYMDYDLLQSCRIRPSGNYIASGYGKKTELQQKAALAELHNFSTENKIRLTILSQERVGNPFRPMDFPQSPIGNHSTHTYPPYNSENSPRLPVIRVPTKNLRDFLLSALSRKEIVEELTRDSCNESFIHFARKLLRT